MHGKKSAPERKPPPRGSPKSEAEHIARRAAELPQAVVAREFGTSQPTVSRRVNGK